MDIPLHRLLAAAVCLATTLAPATAQTQRATPLDEMNQRTLPAMWFDADLGKPVLFGGYFQYQGWGGSRIQQSSGFWGFTSSGLHRLPGDLTSKSTNVAYDPLRRILVQTGPNGETLEWDGIRVTDHGVDPAFGIGGPGALVWDPARRQIMTCRGTRSAANPLETWHWDGTSWTRATTARTPTPRFSFCLGPDSTRVGVVLFGGTDPQGNTLDDTWTWNGTDWAMAATTSPRPAPLPFLYPPMADDPLRGRTLLVSDGLWEWDGNRWTQAIQPGLRAQALAFDPNRQRMLLYELAGGMVEDEVRILSWDGTLLREEWARTAPRNQGQLTTDLLRGDVAMVHFDPISAAAEVHYGGSRGWTREPLNSAGFQRDRFALAMDPVRDDLVVFGGSDGASQWNGETWLYDRTTSAWRLATASGPPARVSAAAHWDPLGQRVLLFGGYTQAGGWTDETWSWDGRSWSRLQPLHSPPPMSRPGMTTDASSGRVLLAGRSTRSNRLEVWDWNGTDWTAQNAPHTGSEVLSFGSHPDLDTEVLVLDAEQWVRDGSGVWSQPFIDPLPPFLFSMQLAWEPATRNLLLRGHQEEAGLWALTAPFTASWAAAIGEGCVGSLGEPRLLANRYPRLDTPDFDLRITMARPSAAAALLVSFSPPVFNPGPCSILLQPGTAVAVPPLTTDAAGQVALALPVPATPTLAGGAFVTQAAVLDPAGGFANLLALTNGVWVVVGR